MNVRLSVTGCACWTLLVMICTLLLNSGCGRREENKARESAASEAAINSYSTENVFEDFLRKVKADPKNAEHLYQLAELYDRNGQYEKAVDTFAKVIELKPDMGYAYLKMGTAYSRINQPEKAIEALNKAVTHLPGNPMVLNNLGIVYGKLERWDDEIVALKKAIAIRPQYASARFNLGLTYMKKGNMTAARAEYQALKEFDVTMARELLHRLEAGKKE